MMELQIMNFINTSDTLWGYSGIIYLVDDAIIYYYIRISLPQLNSIAHSGRVRSCTIHKCLDRIIATSDPRKITAGNFNIAAIAEKESVIFGIPYIKIIKYKVMTIYHLNIVFTVTYSGGLYLLVKF